MSEIFKTDTFPAAFSLDAIDGQSFLFRVGDDNNFRLCCMNNTLATALAHAILNHIQQEQDKLAAEVAKAEWVKQQDGL